MNNVNTQNNGLTFSQLNDVQKQNLASKLLDVHPMRLQNNLVEYVLQKSHEDSEAPFSVDDITNNEPTQEIELSDRYEELTESERDELLEELKETLYEVEARQNYEESEQYETLVSDIEALEEMEDFANYPEIYQWFSCSDWLIRALEEKGECTLDNEFWGRQCCGQSVVLDSVIQEIAFDWFVDYEKDYLTWEQITKLC